MAQPTQTDPQFKLRLPAALKDRIESAAAKNNRSMNAEMVAALEDAFPVGMTIGDIVMMFSDRIDGAKTYEELRSLERDLNAVATSENVGYTIKVKEAPSEDENQPTISFYPIRGKI